MVSRPQPAVSVSAVHVRQSVAHVMARDHGHVFNSKGLKYVFLEIVVESQTSGALQRNPGPVDTNLSSSATCSTDPGEGTLRRIPNFRRAGKAGETSYPQPGRRTRPRQLDMTTAADAH